jgi:hypothetical protein
MSESPYLDDTGAPLSRNPQDDRREVVVWVPLRTNGLHVGVTEERIADLAAMFPHVDVRREFLRFGGIADWNNAATPRRRKKPGRMGFWRHVATWLKEAEARELWRQRRQAAPPVYLGGALRTNDGDTCECGAKKAPGSALCQRCADAYTAYVRDSLARGRNNGETA